MSRDSKAPHPGADQIAIDHHNLRTTFGQLQDAPDGALVIATLRRLREELVEHFKVEEGDNGLADAIGEAAPNALNTLDRLFEEHAEFLTTIDRLIAQAPAALDQPDSALRGEIKDLCRALEEHEATETELLSAAVFTDLGTSE